MQNRRLDMLRAAMPYAAPNLRKPIQVIIQAEELASFIQDKDEGADINACDMKSVGDVEGMMESLREFSVGAERETIDMILNFVRVQKMYKMYRMYMQTVDKASNNGNSQMMDFLMANLTPEQQNTFSQMSAMMNME